MQSNRIVALSLRWDSGSRTFSSKTGRLPQAGVELAMTSPLVVEHTPILLYDQIGDDRLCVAALSPEFEARASGIPDFA